MRIKGIQLAGLAVVLAGGAAAKDAFADTTVSTATTTPLATSTAGNVTIASGGSIAVTTGQAAVTANGAGLNITNSGALSSNNANNSAGIVLGSGGSGTISSTSSISLVEDYTPTDTDNDGDLDGQFAIGTNRNGILLSSGLFTGNVTSSGSTTIEGNNSAGILLNGSLIGDLSSTGSMAITGDNTYGIALTGGLANPLTGNVNASGGGAIHGANATGLLVGAPVTGNVSVNGAWTVSGYRNTSRPADVSHLDADDLLQGGSAVDVRFGVGQGVTIAGVGVEQDASENAATATLTAFGSAPTIHIAAGATADVVLGADSHGFGLDVRGGVFAAGVYDGVVATAVRIEGSGAHSVTVTGGAAFDNLLSATAIEANAYGVYIGANANVPSILERKSFVVSSVSETAQTAYGFFIASGATAPSINNSGSITAQLFGEIGNATAIVDNSNTLASITNSGTLIAQITQTDSDPNDSIPPPAITGTATAIDVSASSINVTLNQNATSPFTDDDAVDNDAAIVPAVTIIGDIRFGSGNDIFNLNAGTATGALSFGAGTDAFNIAGGAVYTGRLSDSDGQLTVNVGTGTANLTGGAANITSANFGSGAVVTLQLAANPLNSATIVASGAVNFANNSRLTVLAPAGLPLSAPDQTILTAASLTIDPGAHVTDNLGVNTSHIYNFDINRVGNTLTASYVLKTPTELGFSANQGAAYGAILQALRNDVNSAAAVGAIQDATTFNTAYAELMPSYSSASAELAATAIQQEQSATTNRLAATRLHNLNEVSAWAQEIGYVVNRTPPDANGEEFRGNGFGFAIGIDGPLNNGALFGLSASFVASDAEQPIRPDGRVSSSFGQLNAYLGTAIGPVDLDFVGGVGAGKLRERRFIEIGSFRQIAEANWWSYEGHGMVRASAPMTSGGWLTITPQAALTYVGLSEQGYDEQDAGALNISADSAFTQRLWGDVGVELSARMFTRGQTVIAPRLSVGYRANLITGGGDRTFRFAGGSDFTLTDDDYGSGGPTVGVGLDATNGYSTLSLSYEGEFGDQIKRNSLNVALRFRF